MDVKHILSGDDNERVSEWAVPEDILSKDAIKEQVARVQCSDLKILAIDTIIHDACIMGDLTTAKQLLTQEIEVDANSHTSYANHSFVMARRLDWDRALDDANKFIF